MSGKSVKLDSGEEFVVAYDNEEIEIPGTSYFNRNCNLFVNSISVEEQFEFSIEFRMKNRCKSKKAKVLSRSRLKVEGPFISEPELKQKDCKEIHGEIFCPQNCEQRSANSLTCYESPKYNKYHCEFSKTAKLRCL
jgi:hypothetical protein